SVACPRGFRVPLADPPPSDTYTLSLHDALPIFAVQTAQQRRTMLSAHHDRMTGTVAEPGTGQAGRGGPGRGQHPAHHIGADVGRSEEHTSELQSRENLGCRLLLEQKKTNQSDT